MSTWSQRTFERSIEVVCIQRRPTGLFFIFEPLITYAHRPLPYFYAPFSAWMIGSRPGSGSAALIAYDGAERPDLIARDAARRVYDGRPGGSRRRARILSAGGPVGQVDARDATLCGYVGRLPVYEWTPKGSTSTKSSEEASGPQRSHGAAVFLETVSGVFLLW